MAQHQHHDDSFMDKLKRFFTGDDADFSRDDEYYRTHHSSLASGSTGSSSADFETVRPAYRLGHHAGMDDRYAGRSFDEAETDLRSAWDATPGDQRRHDWDAVRPFARDAYTRGQEQRLVLNEERLAVGKREYQAGEVELQKRVETDHVQERVALTHDEVVVERRAIEPTDVTLTRDSGAIIGDGETIRVPLMAEEAVVEKRVVPTEEVVLRTQAVTEEQVIDETVRRETLDTTGLDESGRGRRASGDREVPLTGGLRADEDDLGSADRSSRRLESTRDRIDDLRT